MPSTRLFLDPENPEAVDASVVARLRQRIIDGRLAPGSRVTEAALAEALGVSRTPVRLALRTLVQEGLLQQAGPRTLLVRAFSAEDVRCALEVRGVLEGLAARRLAERGLPDGVRAVLVSAIKEGRDVLAVGALTPDLIDRWSRLNRQFHGAIVAATGSPVVGDAIARNNHLPFASADSITLDTTQPEAELTKLRIAQLHHELVLEALVSGESARVEMLMREHAWIGLRYGPARAQAWNPPFQGDPR